MADKINLMVFSNGRVTVTGCKCEEDVDLVKRMLAIILPHNPIEDVTTYTINAHFDLGGPLDTCTLSEHMGHDQAKYNPETYSIEVIDPENGVKCILFNTGSVSMFRAKSETCAHNARGYVIRLLQDQGMLASTYTVPDVPGQP
jgi:TATA-box binding protein (TBP) (component of TFIID and TFIIIB)